MLTRVDVQSENPFVLNIRDARPTDSIIVESIEGLGPPDIDLFMGDYVRDGGFYSGRRVPPRDVTFMLRYNPNYEQGESVSGLRNMLYKAFLDPFPTADNTNFILHDDEVADRYISGYTSKFEGDLFSDETIAQIAVQCPNPYLLDVAPTVIPAAGPSLPFQYFGSAETGLTIIATVTSSTPTLTLNLNGDVMVLTYAFQVGDKVTINTVRGFRSIQLLRTVVGVPTTFDVLYALTSSGWLALHGLTNVLTVYGASVGDNVANLSSINFSSQYWGV
jgi:hypothetical protein